MASTEDRISNLEARVNQIDGANLSDPTKAELAKIRKELAGLKTTFRQTVLEMQRQLDAALKAFNEQKLTVQSHLNP